MSEVHRYNVGDIEVTVVPDGFRMVPLDNYIMNASKEEINAALAAAGLPPDKVKNTYCPIVVTTGGKRVLFDTGVGEAQAAPSKGERGTLNSSLAAAGIDRGAIDIVVISHFHADHVNGLLDAAGNLTLVGRRGDMYIRGGYNVHPGEVERALADHPGVKQAAVIGRPAPVIGEIGVAFVVPRDPADPPTLAELRAHVSAELADYKAPDELLVVDELPLTAMLKPDRVALRDLMTLHDKDIQRRIPLG